MNMYLLLLFILCVTSMGRTRLPIKRTNFNVESSICSNPARQVTLKFDEIQIPTAEGYNSGLQQPYNGYIFTRVNTPYSAYPYNYVPVLNTSNPVVDSVYMNTAVSRPNVLLSTGESLSISYQSSGSKSFSLLNFYMTSVYLNNLAIFVNTFNNGALVNRTTITLPLQVPTQIVVNAKNIDVVLIGCVNPDYNNCYPFVYDDFSLC